MKRNDILGNLLHFDDASIPWGSRQEVVMIRVGPWQPIFSKIAPLIQANWRERNLNPDDLFIIADDSVRRPHQDPLPLTSLIRNFPTLADCTFDPLQVVKSTSHRALFDPLCSRRIGRWRPCFHFLYAPIRNGVCFIKRIPSAQVRSPWQSPCTHPR